MIFAFDFFYEINLITSQHLVNGALHASSSSFGWSSLGQLLLLAHFGNTVQSASDEVSTAIYESNWIDADTEYKKILLMAMISVRNDLRVKAGKIFDINLANFLFVSILLALTSEFS